MDKKYIYLLRLIKLKEDFQVMNQRSYEITKNTIEISNRLSELDKRLDNIIDSINQRSCQDF